MKDEKRAKKPLTFLLIVFTTVIFMPVVVWGISDIYIGVSTKISVCGNAVIEGGEDCEGINLNNQTCQSQGYGPGILSCDIACTFDFYDCFPAPTSTPTPTLTPTPTSVPTLTPTSVPATTSNPTNSPTVVPTVMPTSTPTPILPAQLFIYDFDQDGHLKVVNLERLVRTWVENWRSYQENKLETALKICDTDLNRRCSITDFSVLLYYIGK